MKRIIIFIFSVILIISFSTCNTDTGTPPALVLSFSINSWWSNPGVICSVDYTLSNNGEDDLQNCKILIGYEVDGDNDYDDYTHWTSGVDLVINESHSATADIILNGTDNVICVMVLAAGFDNPPDPESKNSSRTVIYYQ